MYYGTYYGTSCVLCRYDDDRGGMKSWGSEVTAWMRAEWSSACEGTA